MLGLAVVATLAANVAYGVPYGLTGAVLPGWPAVAFIGCAEMAIGMVRRTQRVPAQVPSIRHLKDALRVGQQRRRPGEPAPVLQPVQQFDRRVDGHPAARRDDSAAALGTVTRLVTTHVSRAASGEPAATPA